jgi:hypothetical protein
MAVKDDEIDPEFKEGMHVIASALDELFNEDKKGKDRTTGFVLLIFPFSELDKAEPRCNYISNADRENVVTLLKEMVARFEGQPEMRGHA